METEGIWDIDEPSFQFQYQIKNALDVTSLKHSKSIVNIFWEPSHHFWVHGSHLEFCTLFSFYEAASVIMACLLSTVTLSYVLVTLAYLMF
jgi:hypothetical protein